MARTKKPRIICALPKFLQFAPTNKPVCESVRLTFDEFESLRLHDLEHLNQEEVAKQMNVSRPTVTDMLSSAHEKVADALFSGKQIILEHDGCTVCENGCGCPHALANDCRKKHRCGASCRNGRKCEPI